jgi:hypothetical protein
MPLNMLYALATPVTREDAVIDLVSNSDRFHAFFQNGGSDSKFMQFAIIKFKAQRGYSLANITKADYLESSMGIPVVSKAFINALSHIIEKDIVFYPCEVDCGGIILPFYVGKILTYTHLVNPKTSEFRKLTDGREVLRFPKYETLEKASFFIARDEKFTHLFAASEILVTLIRQHNLQINTSPLAH